MLVWIPQSKVSCLQWVFPNISCYTLTLAYLNSLPEFYREVCMKKSGYSQSEIFVCLHSHSPPQKVFSFVHVWIQLQRHICSVPSLPSKPPNQSADQLTHSLCGFLRSFSVTPTALLFEWDTKERGKSWKQRGSIFRYSYNTWVRRAHSLDFGQCFSFPFLFNSKQKHSWQLSGTQSIRLSFTNTKRTQASRETACTHHNAHWHARFCTS